MPYNDGVNINNSKEEISKMLILSVPKSEPTGKCQINSEPAEYRVLSYFLEFRYEGQEFWNRRRILDYSQNGDLIQLFCDDGQSSE